MKFKDSSTTMNILLWNTPKINEEARRDPQGWVAVLVFLDTTSLQGNATYNSHHVIYKKVSANNNSIIIR